MLIKHRKRKSNFHFYISLPYHMSLHDKTKCFLIYLPPVLQRCTIWTWTAPVPTAAQFVGYHFCQSPNPRPLIGPSQGAPRRVPRHSQWACSLHRLWRCRYCCSGRGSWEVWKGPACCANIFLTSVSIFRWVFWRGETTREIGRISPPPVKPHHWCSFSFWKFLSHFKQKTF